MNLRPFFLSFTVLFSVSTIVLAGEDGQNIRIRVRLMSQQVALGKPVLAQFTVENITEKPITLTVPGTEPQLPQPEIGLPISHVFSGGVGGCLSVSTDSGRRWDQPVGYRPPKQAPILLLAPKSVVGTTLDLRDFYPTIRTAGQYRLTWRAYGGDAVSDTVVLTIAPFKNVEIVTDDGIITLKMHYEDSPANVANFLELVKSGFYSGKIFHRLEPGYMIQGGCPRGDGSGIRTDGKRIPGEINGRLHARGTVSMALLDDDPNSASCQFFICYTDQRDWDGRYTIFAELAGEASFETLDKLMATPVDEYGKPTRTLYMRTVRIVDAPPEQTAVHSPSFP